MILEKLSSPQLPNRDGKGNDLEFSIKLAKDYKNRNLLKCIYEFFLISNRKNQDKDTEVPNKDLINKMEYFDKQVIELTKIVKEYRQEGYPIFLDVSRAPSIPLAPKKEEVTSIMIMNKQQSEYEKSFDKIPLINAITGYLDMIRIYTTREKRKFFENVFRGVV